MVEYPVDEGLNAGVDARKRGGTAPNSIRNDASKLVDPAVADRTCQRSARITLNLILTRFVAKRGLIRHPRHQIANYYLAGVPAALHKASAELSSRD